MDNDYSQLTELILSLWGDQPPVWLLNLANYEELVYSLIAFIPSVFIWLVRYYEKDKRKYSGLWQFVIHWDTDWAKEQLRIPAPDAPNSIGTVILSFCDNTRATDYKGRGFYELHSSGGIKDEGVMSSLVIEYTDAVLARPLGRFFTYKLASIKATTLRRYHKNEEDSNGRTYFIDESAKRTYLMRFETSTSSQLKGSMYFVDATGEKEVGKIDASCEG